MKTIRLHAFVFGKAFFRANCFRGVAQDRGKGERFGLLWETSPTPGVGEVLWEPTGEQTTNPLHIHPAPAFKQEGGGNDKGATKNNFHPFVFEVLPLFFL